MGGLLQGDGTAPRSRQWSADTHPGLGADLPAAVQEQLHHVRVPPFGGHVQGSDPVLCQERKQEDCVAGHRGGGAYAVTGPKVSTFQCLQFLKNKKSTQSIKHLRKKNKKTE